MALTKVSGGILDPGINVAGIVTATGFDGPFTGGSTKNITAGIITATGFDLNGNGDISGNLVIGGNLTANGDFTTLNTTLREVEILRVDANTTAVAGIITQRGSGDIFSVYDTSTEVFKIADGGNVNIGVGLTLGDNVRASFGNSNDLQILHNSSENHFLVNQNTFFKGDIFWGVRNSSNQGVIEALTTGRTVTLYGGTIKVLSTSGIGVTIRQGLHIENAEFNMTTNGSKVLDFETGGSNTVNFRHNPSDGSITTFMKATHGGSLELYDDSDGNVKLTTQGSGVFISGALRLQGTEAAYRTGQAQPLIYRSGSTSGTYPFNNFGHLIIQTRIDGSNRDIIFATGSSAANQIVINSNGDMKIPDGKELQFGGPLDSGDGDLRLHHNATDSYVSNSTGHLRIGNTHDNKNIKFFTDGSTKWNIDSDGHFIPDTAGAVNIGSATAEIGDVFLADDKSVQIGNSQDLKIFHDSSANNNVIEGHLNSLNLRNYNVNCTDIVLSARRHILLQTNLNETGLQCLANGATELFYDGGTYTTPKLRTSTTGIEVTGEVAASQDYPNFRPKIDLNFVANSRMDPRISYSRTGPASFINSKGLVEYVGPDAPRIDHDPDTGECKGLLIEESRTNITPYSHDMSQFSGYNITKTANDAVAPDGTTTATKIEHGGSGTSYLDYIDNNINAAGAGSYTYSVWIKAPDDQPDGYYGCRIAVLHSTGGNVEPTVSLKKTWTRFSVTKTFSASDPGKLRIHPIMFRAAPGSTYDGKVIPSYVWVWGPQIEAGAYSTSYIPPNSAPPYQISGSGVTRGTEYAFIEGQDFADTYNDHEGTFLLQATTEVLSESNQGGWGAEKASNRSGHTFNLGYRVGGGASGYTGAWYTANGSTSAFHNMNAGVTASTPFKIAFSYKVNDMDATTNGATVATDDSAAIDPDFDRFTLGNYQYGVIRKGHIQRAIYYASKITDNQLKTLTS